MIGRLTPRTVNYGDAAKHTDVLLSTKGQNGTSPADEYPMLMTLAEDLDGFKPGELIARAIRQEIMTGALDPKKHTDVEMIRAVATKIEKHYKGVATKIRATRGNRRHEQLWPRTAASRLSLTPRALRREVRPVTRIRLELLAFFAGISALSFWAAYAL